MNSLLKDLKFTVYTTNIEKSSDSGRRIIRGYASVSDVLDRQNEIITHGALIKARNDLLENNTVFYEHKHSELPVGKTVAVDIDEKGLLVTVEFTKAAFANDIWTLIEEGTLNSFSIGGRVLEAEEKRDKGGNLFNEITKIELFEVSVVGLPANIEAKFELISKSFNMAITEEMRKREVENKMSKDEQKQEKSTDETPITEKETNVDKDSTEEVEKSSNKAKEEIVEKKVEKKDEVSEEKVEDTDESKLEKSEEIPEDKSEEKEVEVEKSEEESTEEKEVEIEKKEEEVLQKDHTNNATDEVNFHWHEAAVDENGNGETTTIVTKEGYAGDANHTHPVVDGEVQTSDDHEHILIVPISKDLEEEEVEDTTEKSEESKEEEVVEKENEKEESLTETPSTEEILEEESEEEIEEEVQVEEKSTDEQILELLGNILQEMKSGKEEVSEKSTDEQEEVETSAEEALVEVPVEEKEVCECGKSEEKSKEKTDSEEKEVEVEKKVEIKPEVSEENKEEKISTRKGEVIIVETPYSNENDRENNVDPKVSKAVLKKAREKQWVKLLWGK